MTLEKVVKSATDSFASRKGNQAFDPAMIDVFLSLIMDLVSMFRDVCGLEFSKAADVAQKPSLLATIRLRFKVRRELGWQEWRNHGEDVVAAVLDAGKTCKAETMRDLYNEV